jgi:hypothetical protein
MSPRRGGWTDWVTPVVRGYFFQCCDCGLVHEMQFKALEQITDAAPDGTWLAQPVPRGRVSFRARRVKK